jgi:Mrp family chromosome partitioning ATPase
MSRNFELLQQVGREQEVFHTDPVTQVAPPSVKRPTPHLPGDQAGELERLVERVFLLPSAKSRRIVVFTSPEPGSGCSWVCFHASEILASKTAGSVCVVDANLSSPTLHNRFGVKNHYGLTDALMQPEPIRKFATSISDTNLWLLSGGGAVANWQSLLASERGSQRMNELRSEFDHVLIDAPPMNQSTSTMLATAADGVVLVLKANSSRREVARKATEDLKAANVHLLGAVLNQRTFPIPPRIYSKL